MVESDTGSVTPDYVFEPRISLITLAVSDLPRSVAFYEKLGWRRSEVGGDEVAFFQLGPAILAIWSRDELARDANVSPEGNGFRGTSLAYNVRHPEEVDRALARVALLGATVTRPATDAFWGGRTGYFSDPDGNLWEIAWNPGFPLDDQGAVHLPDGPPSAKKKDS